MIEDSLKEHRSGAKAEFKKRGKNRDKSPTNTKTKHIGEILQSVDNWNREEA